MADPAVIYRVVRGTENSDEEAGGAASSDDGSPPIARSTQEDEPSAVVETQAFLERQDSEEYVTNPIAKRNCGRCGARTMLSVSAGLVLALVLIVAVLSQTLSIVSSRSPSTQPQLPPGPPQTEAESNSEASAADPAPPSGKLVDYTWDGKKCFESNAELRVAIDSYLLDRNNATLQQLYGLPIGMWCVRHIRDFAFAFASEGRKFSFPDRDAELRDLMEKFNDDISGWDITGAKSLDRMFRGAKNFNQDLSKWDVSRVESMLGTFEFTQRFDADIRNWDVSKVKIFTAMFYQAQAFGRNLVYWNVSSATDMVSMFRNAPRFDHDMCPWAQVLKANNLTTMSVMGMFMNSGCPDDTMVGPFFGEDPRWSLPGPFCHSCE